MGLKAAMIPELMEEEELSDLLGMRVALEVGLAPLISANATDGMISQLESIVETAERFKDAKYAPMSDYSFHSKLWEIAGNSQAEEFEKETYPLVEYADLHFADRLDLNRRRLESARQCPGHRELVDLLHKGEPEPFRKALAAHLKVYELRG
jgi:Transcriptional regulators